MTKKIKIIALTKLGETGIRSAFVDFFKFRYAFLRKVMDKSGLSYKFTINKEVSFQISVKENSPLFSRIPKGQVTKILVRSSQNLEKELNKIGAVKGVDYNVEVY